MTIQYWEVMRRFRLETCIDGIDLVLFVPLRLIGFIPDGNYAPNLSNFNRDMFIRRYDVLLKYADNLLYALPYKYCTGLNLIKKFAAFPDWKMENINVGSRQFTVTFTCNLLTCDDLTASLTLKNRKGTIAGIAEYTRRKLSAYHETRKALYQELRDIRNGKAQIVCTGMELKEGESVPTPKWETVQTIVTCKFMIPNNIADDDLSHITLHYSCEGLEYTLYQNSEHVDKKKTLAEILNPINHLNPVKTFDLLFGNKKSDMPEAFRSPTVILSPKEVIDFGAPIISNLTLQPTGGFDGIGLMLSNSSLTSSVVISLTNSTPILRYTELQEMEGTMHHIASKTLHYSQAIWASLSDDERAMMLEQYTIDMDFGKMKDLGVDEDVEDVEDVETKDADVINIPLLNCVNIKKMLGFYGNCILLPFTYPQELAKKLKKTAAEVQDSLYRYHTHCFRVPTTTISLPTDGMIGEAVLGETNVSELIDITRFWNWKDSPIDKMELNNQYLNNTDYLADKTTKDIEALNIQGATPAVPVTVPDLIAALVNKQTPQFADITGLEHLKEVLNAGTSSAASGRKEVLDTTAKLAELSVEVLKNNKSSSNNANKPATGTGNTATDKTTYGGTTSGGITTGGTTTGGTTYGGTTTGGTTTGGTTTGGVTTGGTLDGDTIIGGVTTGGTTTGGTTTGGTTTGGTTIGGTTAGGTTSGGITSGGTTVGGGTGGSADENTISVFKREEVFKYPNVRFYPQLSMTNGCWAACASMLRCWKKGDNLRIDEYLLQFGGQGYVDLFFKNEEMPREEWKGFITLNQFASSQSISAGPSYYLNLLKNHGPIILITDENPSSIFLSNHARVLYGMGTSGDNPLMLFLNPLLTRTTGVEIESYNAFIQKFEQAGDTSGLLEPIVYFEETVNECQMGIIDTILR